MKMDMESFNAKLREYATTRFIPSVANPATRFLLGMAAGANAIRLDLAGTGGLRTLGIVDADGKVDVDVMKAALMGGFDASKEGFPVNRFGIGKLERGDAEAFLSFLGGKPPEAA